MKNLPWKDIQSRPAYQDLDDKRKKLVQEKWYGENVKAHPQYAKLNPQQEQQVRQTLFQQKQAGPTMGTPEIARQTANRSGQNSQNQDTNWTDLAKSLAGGALNTGQLMLRGAQVASPLPDVVAEKLGTTKAMRGLENVLKRGEEALSESQSEEWKQAQATKYVSDKEGELFGDAWSLEHLEKPVGTILRSAPSMLLGMGTGQLVIRGLLKAGMNKGLAGIIGSAIGEGGVAGGDAAKTAYDMVAAAPDEQLVQSEEYRDAILKTDPNLPIEEQHALAKKMVARDAAIKTGAVVTAAVSAFGAPSGAAMGRLVGGEAGKTTARTIAKQAGLEAAQEIPQSATERLAQNVVEREYVDPEKDIMEGVAEAAVEGGVAGAVMGGAMGGAVRPRGVAAAKTGADAAETGQPADPSAIPFDATQTMETAEPTAEITPENVREITQEARQGIDPNATTQEFTAEELAAEAEKERRDELVKVRNLEGNFRRGLNDADRAAIQRDVAGMDPARVGEIYSGQNGADKYARNFARLLELDPAAAEKIGGQASRRAAREIAPEQRGAAGRAFTPKNNPIDFEYAVVEAGDLIASHNDQLQQDQDYPQELQPRDRSRGALEVQVNRMANAIIPEKLLDSASVGSGAPIVGDDLLVESGNGRTIALRRAYQNQKGEAYRAKLAEDAGRFGLDPAQVAGMDAPMLVRIRKSNVGRTEFVKEANQPEVAGMSPAEQAKADAESIRGDSLALLAPDEAGNLSAASNDIFVKRWVESMGANEAAGLLSAGGQLTKQGYDRLQSAIFAKAYNDPSLVEMQAEAADPDLKNILNALTAASPEFAQARGIDPEMGGIDIAQDISEAARILKQARAEGVSVKQILDQGGLFESRRAETEMMAGFLDANIKSSKRMGIALKEMGRLIKQDLLNRNQQSLFGDNQNITAAQAVERGINVGNESAGPTGQPGARAGINEAGDGAGQLGDLGGAAAAYAQAGPRSLADAGINLEDIQSAFKNQIIKTNADGSYSVQFSGQKSTDLKIEAVDRIGIDEAAFRIAYKRPLTGSQKAMGAAGSYQSGEIKIARIGDRWTLHHEAFHFLIDSGMLTQAEVGALQKAARQDGAATEEDVANWMESALAEREAYRERGAVYRVLQRVGDFIDSLANLVTTTAGRTVRGMESGAVYDRAGQAQGFETAEAEEVRYSVPDVIRNKFGRAEAPTLRERVDAAAASVSKNWRTRLVDNLHPIRAIGEKAYRLHRLSNGTQAVLQTFLEHGKLKWDGQVLTADTQKEGFVPWLRNLGEDGQKLMHWMAAKRAERLAAEGRENWLSETDRKEILAWVGEKAADGRSWTDLNKEFQEFNQSVLKLAEEAGLIKRGAWADEDIYIPFYRILENAEAREEFLKSPRQSGKNIDAQIKRLEGGEAKLGDPMENILKNWSHLITESVRNVARQEAFESAKARGGWSSMLNKEGKPLPIVQEVVKESVLKAYLNDNGNMAYVTRNNDENILSFNEKGEKKYFKVNDAELYAALLNSKNQGMDNMVGKMFSIPKRILTSAATFGPAFRVANVIRDTMHTAIISKSFIPFLDSVRGFGKAWAQDEDYVRLMASGGGFGSDYLKSDDPRAAAKYIDAIVSKEGKQAKARILNSPKKLLEFWEKVGAASETAARVALYAKRRNANVTSLDAAYEARDLLDFSMRGSAGAVGFLVQSIPFLNARMQGLYKLDRAFRQDKKSFAIKGGMLTLASLALWAHNSDDDRYKALEDWEKRTYYHFWAGEDHYRIPKPFEVGAVFSSMAEAAMDTMLGDEDIGYFGAFLKATASETFMMNPIPQAIRPAVEVWANKSFFTKRQIEGPAAQRLKPGARGTDRTSETLRALGEQFNVSPLKLEALVNGYLSTFGALALAGTDMVTRQAGSFPVRPRAGIQQYPLIGRFMRDPVVRSTKYTTRFYELLESANQLTATVSEYRKTGDYEAATRLYHEGMDTIRFRPLLNKTQRRVSKMNQQIREAMYARHLSPDQKRKRIDALTERKTELIGRVYQRYMEAGKS